MEQKRNTEQANALGTNPEKLSNCSFGAVAVPLDSYTAQQFGGRWTCSSGQRHPHSDFLCALASQRDRFHWNRRKLLTTRNLNGGSARFFSSEPKYTSSALLNFALLETVAFAFSHDLFVWTSCLFQLPPSLHLLWLRGKLQTVPNDIQKVHISSSSLHLHEGSR